MAFNSVKKGVDKNGNPGRPNAKTPAIIIFKTDDLKYLPAKGLDGVSVVSDIVLKSGTNAMAIYATASTIKFNEKSNGDADKKGFIASLEFEYPGSGVEYSAFINDNINENLMAIVLYPDLGFNKLLGWPGCPLQLNHEQKDDEKEDTNVVKLESLFAGDKSLHYYGALPMIEVETSHTDLGGLQIPYIVTESYQIIVTELGEVLGY